MKLVTQLYCAKVSCNVEPDSEYEIDKADEYKYLRLTLNGEPIVDFKDEYFEESHETISDRYNKSVASSHSDNNLHSPVCSDSELLPVNVATIIKA